MENTRGGYGGLPVHDSHSQPGLEPRPFENGLYVLPPNQAGLEVKPTGLHHHLILSRDDEKMARMEYSQETHRSNRLFGLSARTFWICLVTFGLVVIAIAVGAGVGASKRLTNSATSVAPTATNTTSLSTTSPPLISTTDATATTTTSAPAATATTNGCKNGTTYLTTNNTPFQEYCDTDFRGGALFNSTAADWNYLQNVGTFEGCMELCAFDRSQGLITGVDGQCLSVTWVSTAQHFGDCWMKNNTVQIGSFNQTIGTAYVVPKANVGLDSAWITG